MNVTEDVVSGKSMKRGGQVLLRAASSKRPARGLAEGSRQMATFVQADGFPGMQEGPPQPEPLNLNIAGNLTQQEADLFMLLLESVKAAGSSTVVRVAGGWVRDKLLGRDNDDIDIALDNTSGAAFAEVVNQQLTRSGQTASKAAIIQANPEQSKHLETARMKIGTMWVDLVNLRTESYQTDSRIPEIQFGTAQEDARRRDFTINSLFYNVSAGGLEDFTGRGVADLSRGIIRTPLPAAVTFTDDPLRILRAVRFAARFNFALDDELRVAAMQSDVQAALAAKVSKERVGLEVDGMLCGQMARPGLAISLLNRLRLLPVVFAPPPPVGEFQWHLAEKAAVWANRIVGQRELPHVLPDPATQMYLEPMPEHRILFLCASLMPLQGYGWQEKKGKVVPQTNFVIRESLKLKTKDMTDVSLAFSMVANFQRLAKGTRDRLEIGSVIRQAKDLWRVCVDVACLAEICQLGDDEADRAHSQATINQYSEFLQRVEAMGLSEVWSMKPLLDGAGIMEQLGAKKGPVVGKLMEEQVKWQLQHPQGTREECILHLHALLASWRQA